MHSATIRFYRFSSYRTVNALRFCYKVPTVNFFVLKDVTRGIGTGIGTGTVFPLPARCGPEVG